MSEGGEEMASLPVPDELLAEIFLRLPNSADFVRGSTACVSFHRVATDRSFLRRYRKLNAAPVLGFLEGRKVFHPAIAPYPSASAAMAVALAADFSFAFLPAPARTWIVQDIRDGRVLLDRAKTQEAVFREMVVCDPLHRRYLLLPPIPADLVGSVADSLPPMPQVWCETFLVPPADDEAAAAAAAEEATSFRVIWMAQCKTKLFAFVFSSSTEQWRAIQSQSWSNLFASLPSPGTSFRFRQYSYGCFYWRTDCEVETNMLVLDTRRMEFSTAEPPPESKYSYGLSVAMVEAGESRPGMFVLPDGASALSYSIRQNDGGSSSQWQKVKTILLGSGHRLLGSMGRYLLLYKLRSSLPMSGFYTLDVETFQLEKMCDTSLGGFLKLHAYSNFPPSLLSLPTISSGADEEVEE